MGTRLGALINGAILARARREGVTPGVIDERVGRAAGISGSTMNQIESGSIDCPPRDRLQRIAGALNMSTSSLMAAARQDGCDYG